MRRRRKHSDVQMESGYKPRRPAQWVTASADKVQRAHSSDDTYYQSLQHLATTSTSSCDTLEDEAIRQEELEAEIEVGIEKEERLLPIASTATSFVSRGSSPLDQSLLEVSLSPAATSRQAFSSMGEAFTDNPLARQHAANAVIFPNDNFVDALRRLEAGGSEQYPLESHHQPEDRSEQISSIVYDGKNVDQTPTSMERSDSLHTPPHSLNLAQTHQLSTNSINDNHHSYQQQEEPRQHQEMLSGNQQPQHQQSQQPAHGYRWKAYTPSVIPVVKSTRNMVIVGAVLTSDLRRSLQEMQRVLDIVSTPPVTHSMGLILRIWIYSVFLLPRTRLSYVSAGNFGSFR